MQVSNPGRKIYNKYAVCSVDYFSEEIKSDLETLLGHYDEPRLVEPICGTVIQDIKGTVKGLWFVENTSSLYPEDQHLALVDDNFDPEPSELSNFVIFERQRHPAQRSFASDVDWTFGDQSNVRMKSNGLFTM